MGFTSLDDLIDEITNNGKIYKSVFNKRIPNGATGTAGNWYETFTGQGVPGGGSFSGTAGVATAMTRATSGAFAVNGAVTPDTRHIANLATWTPASTLVPATVWIVDYLLYYPSCVITGTATTFDNTVTLPRYTDGEGVQCIVAQQTAGGASSPAVTITYTDSDGNVGSQGQNGLATPVASPHVGLLYQHSGSPLNPLAAGDRGIRKLDSYTIGGGTTGTVCFILVKILATIPIPAVNTASERDLLYQLPSLPRVYDDACLGLLVSCGGALTTNQSIAGAMDLIWG